MYKKSPLTPKVILGIDPGTTRIGYGVIKKAGGALKSLDYRGREILVLET